MPVACFFDGRPSFTLPVLPALLLAVLSACAAIPPGRYGVTDLDLHGVHAMDADALAACLATAERPRLTLQLGERLPPLCEQPPFDDHPVRIRLWTWPWNSWPAYDQLLFANDLARILRWYQARGFYDARVVETRFEPEAAALSEDVPAGAPCLDDPEEGCELRIAVVIDEGEPVRVGSVTLAGLDSLPADLAGRLHESVALEVGERLDEADYELSKRALTWTLEDAAYARAEVTGRVIVDRERHLADVELEVAPGPLHTIGTVAVRLDGEGDVPTSVVRRASGLEPGDPYRPAALHEAQQAVYDLGVFSSVVIEPEVPEQGDTVNIAVIVAPALPSRFEVGVGAESGVPRRRLGDDMELAPQWNVHGIASWELEGLFGGLRQLRIEERPRAVFSDEFPLIDRVWFGNLLTLEFEQPGFFDARTRLILDARWELGPDPFLEVFRHDVEVGLGLERRFFGQRLLAAVGVREGLWFADDTTPAVGGTVPEQADVLFLEQILRLDLRNDPVRVRSGLYAAVSLHEAGFFLPSDWSYVRVVPELRAYVPLPLGMVLASRFSIGAIFLSEADPTLDPTSQALGPPVYRFRGGGTTSNRGFVPGELGDGVQGGVRRWLAAAELRLPVTANFFLTFFADTGDVSASGRFRFDHPQLSVGAGLRLLTMVWPIRLEVGWRVPGAQTVGRDERAPGGRLTRVDFGFVDFPGAVSFTLGESF